MRPLPTIFLKRPHVLRAIAVYLREPVCVWDVAVDGAAHVQSYTFATLTMANGETHDTGQVEMISDKMMTTFLDACSTNTVFLVMMPLKHTDSHCYGVQHGDFFFDWHAQPGHYMRYRQHQVHEAAGSIILPSAGYNLESV